MKKFTIFIYCFCYIFLVGCVNKTIKYVEVNTIGSQAYQQQAIEKKKFYIEHKKSDNGINDLLYEEMYPHIEGAFYLNGMNPIKDKKVADYIAIVDFGVRPGEKVRKIIEQPQYEVVGYYPVWYTNIYGRSIYPYDYEPIITRTGSKYYEREYTIYPKYLMISVYSNQKQKKGKLEWQIELVNETRSKDFRSSISALLAPLSRFLHEDTRGQKIVRLQFDENQNVIVEDIGQ